MTYLKAKHLLPALLLFQIFSFDTKVKLESFSLCSVCILKLAFFSGHYALRIGRDTLKMGVAHS